MAIDLATNKRRARAMLRAVRAGAAIANKRWLTQREACIYLGCSTATFRKHWKILLTQFRPIGGRPLFDSREIDSAVQASAIGPRSHEIRKRSVA